MDGIKLCSTGGEVMSYTSLPCPPPYSNPYYYPLYGSPPLSPDQESTTTENYSASSSKGGGIPISSGAVAGIIISGGFIFFVLCLFALRCRARFILGYGRNGRSHGELGGDDQLFMSSRDDMVLNVVGCGLEQRLVNLLPVYEYVGLMQEFKERQECAVCLSLFEEKETVRVLPKCHHVFHLSCIDRWFESHANCPLCRERITLQTIQLSLNFSKNSDHDQQPLHPALPSPHTPAHEHDHSDQHPQHAYSSSSRDFCVQINDQRPAGNLQRPCLQQNIFFALPSNVALKSANDPQIAKAVDEPGDTRAASGRLAADGWNCAGRTGRDRGHCDQKSASIPAAISADCLRGAGQNDDAVKEASRVEDDPSAGPAPAMAATISLQRGHKSLNPLAAAGAGAGALSCAGDYEAAPIRASTSSRESALLRKSLSTGSMIIDHSSGKADGAQPLNAHEQARMVRSLTRRLL